MATIGFTAKLELDPGTGTFSLVSETIMISLPSEEATTVESTHLASTGNRKTFVPGLVDPGVMSFECNWSKAAVVSLNAVKGIDEVGSAGTPVRWRISSPDEDGAGTLTLQTITFAGILTKTETSFEVEALAKIKGEVKVSGVITYA